MTSYQKAESKARELRGIMTVINNRLEGMTDDDWNLKTVDPVLWETVAYQLREAVKMVSAISRLVRGGNSGEKV